MYPGYFLSKQVILSIFLMGLIHFTSAQTGQTSRTSQQLYQEIAGMDSVLFEAFNKRDLEKLKTLFSNDLEFFHDKGGLTGFQQNMEAFQNTFEKKNDLRRELVAGSQEVYPVKDYGAIQTGMHRFCHTENGKEECGIFKFVHVWQKKDGHWKITRVISYGH